MTELTKSTTAFGIKFNNALRLYDNILNGGDLSLREVDEAINDVDQAYQIFCYRLAEELGNEHDQVILYSYFESIRTAINCPRMFTEEFQELNPPSVLDAVKLQKALYKACGWCEIRSPYTALAGFGFRYECGLIRGVRPYSDYKQTIVLQTPLNTNATLKSGAPRLYDFIIPDEKSKIIEKIEPIIRKGAKGKQLATITQALIRLGCIRLESSQYASFHRAVGDYFPDIDTGNVRGFRAYMSNSTQIPTQEIEALLPLLN